MLSYEDLRMKISFSKCWDERFNYFLGRKVSAQAVVFVEGPVASPVGRWCSLSHSWGFVLSKFSGIKHHSRASSPQAQGFYCEGMCCISTAEFPDGDVSWPYMSAQIFVYLHVNMWEHTCVSLSLEASSWEHECRSWPEDSPQYILEPQSIVSCTCRRDQFTAEWCSLQPLQRSVQRTETQPLCPAPFLSCFMFGEKGQ